MDHSPPAARTFCATSDQFTAEHTVVPASACSTTSAPGSPAMKARTANARAPMVRGASGGQSANLPDDGTS